LKAVFPSPGWSVKWNGMKRFKSKALNRHGQPVKLKVDGWMARIFQHEIDHLHGVMFTDKATSVWKPSEDERRNSAGLILRKVTKYERH
jgi:peptide deformylase